jgi:hypothetical protein
MHVIDVAEHHDRRKMKSPELQKVWQRLRPIMPKARRFIFDKEASAFAGAFIRDFGPTLLENLQFAIPPFEHCYVEYHLDALLDTIGRRKTEHREGGSADECIGHLIDHNYVYTFIEDSKGEASFYPVMVDLHSDTYTRGTFSSDLEDDEYKKITYTLGSTSNDLKRTSEETLRRWLHNIDIVASPMFHQLLTEDVLRDGGNGTVRNLVALLLMLNRQRERVTLTQVPPKGVIYKGKRKVFMAHSLVMLTTEDYGAITRSFVPAGHHESPRRHQVRGFFRHYHRVRGCEHHFLEDDRPLHWTCQHCGTRLVWVHDHLRGDASKGFVTKEYVVIDPAADVND